MKNYIGISRDHSGSMRSIAHVAAKDYNTKIDSIKEAALAHDQDTIVSVVECGYGRTDKVQRVVVNSSVNKLEPITKYIADGVGTPLFDSVGDLIEQFESMPDKDDPNVSTEMRRMRARRARARLIITLPVRSFAITA